jgi:hypothetical protein
VAGPFPFSREVIDTLFLKRRQGGDEVYPKPRLQVGDQVRLYHKEKKKPVQLGNITVIPTGSLIYILVIKTNM